MLNETDRSGLERFLRSAGPRGLCDQKSLLSVGMLLGAWRIKALIGRGGSGEVYRVVGPAGIDGRADAPHTPQGAENAAALKILWRDDEPSHKRFAAEVKFLAENQLPFLPRLIDSGEWEGRPYLITELLEPIELPSTDSAVAEYLLSVCEAVRVLHLSGIVHRDLKPKNIMRRPVGSRIPRDSEADPVVLIDFGLVKDTSASARPRTDVSIVAGKAVAVGTLGYAAPEQLTGGEISPAADIHALGRIANAAFGGKPPRSWETIIRRATSSIPAQRYETVDDFATAIRKRSRPRNFIRAGFAVAILGLVAGTFFGREDIPLVRDVVQQSRFDALGETITTNVVVRQLLSEKLETNKFGRICLKERTFRNMTNAIDVTLVRLNRGTNVFVRPMQLKPNHEYWVIGPGILDASVTSSGTNTTLRLKNCVFLNRSSVPFENAGIRYVFQGGVYLNFTNVDRPQDFTTRQFEGFDGAFDEIRFKGPETVKGLNELHNKESRAILNEDASNHRLGQSKNF